MRKYQQLFLVVISVISLVILLMYRTENNRLKNVLDVVNFFGRSDDAAVIRIENSSTSSIYDFSSPLPVWQRIGNGFHSYSSFYQKNTLESGSVIITIVAGMAHSIVNFKCQVQFANKIVPGKFGFIRLEHETTLVGDQTENFVIYKFLCNLGRDFGAPSNVIFTDKKLKTEHFVSVRSVETKNVKEKQTLVVCLDMNSYNHSFVDPFTNVTNLLQYFLHYEIIGATEFIVYNPNIFNRELKSMAAKYGIRLNVLPYNFPFELNEKSKNRLIIQSDCLLRNVHLSNFVVITALNEYLYPDSRLRPGNNFLKSIKTISSEVNRFEITKRSVCLDFRKRILIDNYLYNIDMRNEKFYLYRPYQQNDYKKDIFKTHETDPNQISMHQYVKCINRTDLYDWRTILPEGYLNFVYDTGKELNTLMYK